MRLVICSFFLLISFNCLAKHFTPVDTIVVYSNAMHKNVKAVVIKPDNYKKKNTRYSVVYLLHGYGGAYANWIKRVPALKQYANDYNMMIICPDGENSWYINSPVNDSSRFETFITSELVSYVDSSYRTIAARTHRAITGLSMGGHGGLMLGIRHKDVFGAAGSMSGALDLSGLINKYDISKLIGDTIHFKWRNYSVLHLADSISAKGIQLIFDCGVNDFLIQSNRDLHAKLNEQKVPHDYIERPGAHSWEYWSNSIIYQLLFFRRFFDEAEKKS